MVVNPSLSTWILNKNRTMISELKMVELIKRFKELVRILIISKSPVSFTKHLMPIFAEKYVHSSFLHKMLALPEIHLPRI